MAAFATAAVLTSLAVGLLLVRPGVAPSFVVALILVAGEYLVWREVDQSSIFEEGYDLTTEDEILIVLWIGLPVLVTCLVISVLVRRLARD